MREIASGIYLEKKYPGVQVAAIVGSDGLMLVDCPLRADDAREWVASTSNLGPARYLVVLDHHPDRILGSRSLDVPLVAHDLTREEIASWPDAFKGSTHPIGAEADHLKRITGVAKAVPQISFSNETMIYLGDREARLWHVPGHMPGAIWISISNTKMVFIGDTVTKSEPPYFGEADLEAWLGSLDELRSTAFKDHKMISARDGLVDRTAVNAMARFLRRIPPAVAKLEAKGPDPEEAMKIGAQLMSSHRVPSARRDLVLRRMQASLVDYLARNHRADS